MIIVQFAKRVKKLVRILTPICKIHDLFNDLLCLVLELAASSRAELTDSVLDETQLRF